jgi:hypothetical protein
MKHTSWIKQSKRALLLGTALAMGLMSPANAAINNVQEVQTWLTQLGFEPGPADGSYGKRTKQALEAFYQSKGGSFDGELSDNEVQYLREAIKAAGISEGTQSNNVTAAVHAADYSLQISNRSVQSTIELPEYSNDATIVHGINVFDVNEDGRNEVFLCGTTYTNWVDHPVTILEVKGDGAIDATAKYFGIEVPTSNDCTHIHFTDLNADGLKDVVYTDSGSDGEPWKATAIEVALNNGTGFTRITEKFQDETFGIRAYSIAAGNFDDDQYGEILLSSGSSNDCEWPKCPRKSRIIQFDGANVSISKNVLFQRGIWTNDEIDASNIQVVDIDNDGKNDIYVGGTWDTPANKIFWSGIAAKRFNTYKETEIGHLNRNKIYDEMKRKNLESLPVQGASIVSTAIADFDNDGDLDIVNAYEQIIASCKLKTDGGLWCEMVGSNQGGNSFLQILEQTSKRKFNDATQDFDAALGNRYFLDPLIFDINEDGLADIILNYWNKGGDWVNGNNFGSVFLINKGGLSFQKVEAKDILGYDASLRGMIFPIKNLGTSIEVLVLQPRSGRQGGAQRRLYSYTAILKATQ